MNRLYKRGADKERRIVKKARDSGLIAFRSAGSHSPIDLITIDTEKRIIKLVQCKSSIKLRGGIEPKLKEKLEKEWKPIIDGLYVVSFEAL